LIAVALANAELEKKNGKDLITALAAGYEFFCRLCHDFVVNLPTNGFQPGSVFIPMGAAMVAGKLFGLDEEGLMRTIWLAANYASGLNEGGYKGDRQAARSGVFAAMEARANPTFFPVVEQVLEGKTGFYKAFTGSNSGKLTHAFTGPLQIDLASITAGLGQEYKTADVIFKMYPTGGYAESVINLMKEMRQQYTINPDDVAKVVVAKNWYETLYAVWYGSGGTEELETANWNEPRVGSMHFSAAYSLVYGGYPPVGGKSLSPNGVKPTEDKRVIDFMNAKVTLAQERNREVFSAGGTVTMKDGTVYKSEYPYRRLVVTFDQLVISHREVLPGYSLGKAGMDAVAETIRGVDRLASVERIFQVMKT
jgi:2-methylcitrate dehydratase PrpD